jgi:hypothetical protein
MLKAVIFLCVTRENIGLSMYQDVKQTVQDAIAISSSIMAAYTVNTSRLSLAMIFADTKSSISLVSAKIVSSSTTISTGTTKKPLARSKAKASSSIN